MALYKSLELLLDPIRPAPLRLDYTELDWIRLTEPKLPFPPKTDLTTFFEEPSSKIAFVRHENALHDS